MSQTTLNYSKLAHVSVLLITVVLLIISSFARVSAARLSNLEKQLEVSIDFEVL